MGVAAASGRAGDATQQIWLTDAELEEGAPWNSGTDSDTSSDDGTEPIYLVENLQNAGYSPEEIEHSLAYLKSEAKRAHRRYTKKPVRRVRRFA